ncbi:MAG: CPBP family intramembrane metalloprotease [Bacteroidales bacterium]|nr:CPBP family intramembrane metalloprotease [Bacteroidales bacterium]
MVLLKNGVSFPEGLEKFLTSPFNPAAFGPFFSAFILTRNSKGWRGIRELLKRSIDFRFKKIWLIPSFLLLPAIFGGGILISIVLHATEKDLSVITNPPYAIVAFFVILFTAGPLQEEFGWRGFALPHLLQRNNALKSSIILGFFWWLWHLPAVFIPGGFMTDNLLSFIGLAPVIILTSILFTWIYINANQSIFPALLMHTSLNWSIWLLVPSMKINRTIIFCWMILLIVIISAGLLIWGTKKFMHEEK